MHYWVNSARSLVLGSPTGTLISRCKIYQMSSVKQRDSTSLTTVWGVLSQLSGGGDSELWSSSHYVTVRGLWVAGLGGGREEEQRGCCGGSGSCAFLLQKGVGYFVENLEPWQNWLKLVCLVYHCVLMILNNIGEINILFPAGQTTPISLPFSALLFTEACPGQILPQEAPQLLTYIIYW